MDQELDQDSTPGEDMGGPKELREAKARSDQKAKEAEAEARELRKQLTFMKLGIDTDKGVGKLFAESYKGELTEEAIQESLQEYGINLEEKKAETPPADAPQGDTPPPPEARAHQAINQAGSSSAPEVQLSPEERGLQAYDEAFAATNHDVKARAAYLRTLILDENEKVIAARKARGY